ncbi:VOC family protein [Paenibacillus beijingensis]|uniref:Glyoxalase n=1 Tax=Paenibacillus beijingensis TaxID=1126833 RepID=A0A0D5NFF8_9BACL|nr:VOC family protein [Paenibacillus beijingensis]AJY73702.1 glyoxalase [Paenibacillus beijingensis]
MPARKIEHIGIMAKDLEASIEFYCRVIGLEHRSTLTHTGGVIQMAFLSFPGSNETDIELISGYNASLPAEGKVHHAAFTVDDIEAEFDRMKRLNVPLLEQEITTLPNGARYFFFFGPDGEHLEMFQPGQAPA